MMEGAPRSPLGRDGLSPPQRAEVNPLGATVTTGAGSIDDGETCDEPTTTMGRRYECSQSSNTGRGEDNI